MNLQNSILKWGLLILSSLVGAVWMYLSGYQLGRIYYKGAGWIVALVLIAVFCYYTNRDRRIQELAHFGSQYLVLLALLDLFTWLSASIDAPLIARHFDAFDKAIGFDWVFWFQLVSNHQQLRNILHIAYGSLPFQLFFCWIYNATTGSSSRNTEIWWITFLSGIVTIAGSSLFPAINPYVYYGLQPIDHFAHMQQLLEIRAGAIHVIGKVSDEGLVQLPSFHTVLAIMRTYNLRHNKWLFSVAVVLNALVILSCPTEGSHYLIDIVAGFLVVVVSIWMVTVLDPSPAYNGPLVLKATLTHI